MPILEQDIHRIHNLDTFFDFLRDKLGWEIRDDLATADLFYDYDADELRFDRATADQVKVRQIAPFVDGQPWGIFLVETATPRVYITHLRQILRALAPSVRTQRPHQKAWRAENLLFVCAPPEYDRFTFAHFKGDKAATARLATFGWDKDEVGLRTLREFNLPALEWYRGNNPDEWIAQWSAAFDVAKVTNKFFQEYEALFETIKGELRVARGVTQRLTAERRHFFTQRLMNRLLFLCFLQKKRWLDYNPRYLFDLFDYCNELGANFYDEYLWYVLFLGLNRATHRPEDGLPEKELRQRIGLLPFLNGGLFEQADEWDYFKKLDISNKVFDRILGQDGLLRRFNFTVTESTPLDVQVAIDPEMLGRVYEQLISERNKLGAFYTHPVEVRLMVRESLKAYLADRVTFADPSEKIAALIDQERAEALDETQALQVYQALLDVKVCDLAIGSGAFPVAMMREMVEILRRLARTITEGKLRLVAQDKLGDPQSLYALKLYVIQNCIFGADIDAFSVEIAKLRFWLSLVVDNPTHFQDRAEFERRVGEIRPLPNLLYKIRVGDSVLAKVGKINWDVVEYKGLKGSKNKKVKTARNVYDLMSHGALEKIRALKQSYFLMSDVEKQERQREIERAEQDFERALLLGQAIPSEQDKNKYILWQVHFAEVFEGKDSGFDIIIANPPYVKKELTRNEVKTELSETYQVLFTDFHPDKRSDLYVYFYLRALYLLKPHGVLCFICSNSWLDVGFGTSLQEVLLHHTRILGIYDNSAKRSFESADINTTINVFQRATSDIALQNVVRFVVFLKPFDEAITPENLHTITNSEEFNATGSYRVFPITQKKLFEEGLEKDESSGETRYIGSKWGGKYLRAPDIYYTILSRSKDSLVTLDSIADVRLGLTSCDNSYFYMDAERAKEFGIESRFLLPIVKSPREGRSILLDVDRLQTRLFCCSESKQVLKGTRALEYIKRGEKDGVDSRPCLAGRQYWWNVGNPTRSRIVVPYSYNDTFKTFWASKPVVVDKRLVQIIPHNQTIEDIVLCALLNSTFWFLILEIGGSTNMGEGALVFNTADFRRFLILNPHELNETNRRQIKKIFNEMLDHDVLAINEESTQPNRRALDNIIFDALGLTQGERDAVYEAVVELVRQRLEKAHSV